MNKSEPQEPSISGLVVKSNVANVGPRVRFPADATVNLFLGAKEYIFIH
jgi:hypothetical protein